MPRPPITGPTINDRREEEHPSFGVMRLSRVTGLRRLFDSSIPHSEWVTLEISRATRQRDLHTDRIYGSREQLIEIEMSLTQWGAVVSSFNQGSGTPVTLHRVAGETMPEAAHNSRLAETAQEVAGAAARSTEQVREAVKAVELAFERKAGRRELADLLRTLHFTVENVPANMKFAADMLTEHAEDVVSKAKADIEAARQFGGQPAIEALPRLELESSP
jgi:hypothetical protein